mmetsp:Transcript_6677/g.16738  ORF Transcript_6677/g.16738 Transcript_6677/m.16738 type:complete len:200 (-) Transcript_6677:208-807(-)
MSSSAAVIWCWKGDRYCILHRAAAGSSIPKSFSKLGVGRLSNSEFSHSSPPPLLAPSASAGAGRAVVKKGDLDSSCVLFVPRKVEVTVTGLSNPELSHSSPTPLLASSGSAGAGRGRLAPTWVGGSPAGGGDGRRGGAVFLSFMSSISACILRVRGRARGETEQMRDGHTIARYSMQALKHSKGEKQREGVEGLELRGT